MKKTYISPRIYLKGLRVSTMLAGSGPVNNNTVGNQQQLDKSSIWDDDYEEE